MIILPGDWLTVSDGSGLDFEADDLHLFGVGLRILHIDVEVVVDDVGRTLLVEITNRDAIFVRG